MVLCTCHPDSADLIIPIYNHAQYFLQGDGRNNWISTNDHTKRLGDPALY